MMFGWEITGVSIDIRLTIRYDIISIIDNVHVYQIRCLPPPLIFICVQTMFDDILNFFDI